MAKRHRSTTLGGGQHQERTLLQRQTAKVALPLGSTGSQEKKGEREKAPWQPRERAGRVAESDYLALKIVVHSVGGSRHLLGVEWKLRNQLSYGGLPE